MTNMLKLKKKKNFDVKIVLLGKFLRRIFKLFPDGTNFEKL